MLTGYQSPAVSTAAFNGSARLSQICFTLRYGVYSMIFLSFLRSRIFPAALVLALTVPQFSQSHTHGENRIWVQLCPAVIAVLGGISGFTRVTAAPVHPAEIIQTLIQIALLPGCHAPVEVLSGGFFLSETKDRSSRTVSDGFISSMQVRMWWLMAASICATAFLCCRSYFFLPRWFLSTFCIRLPRRSPLFWIPRLIQLLPQILLFSIKNNSYWYFSG